MNQPAGLSFDQAPPIGVPLRFFLTAPLFSLTAALLLLWQGPDLFLSRWNPALLGATHLLTLGHMGMVMLGAILQMLPVVAGAPMRRPALVAGATHSLATGGIILLCTGLIFTLPPLLKLALPLLGTALLLFALLVILTLRHAQPENMTARTMRLAALMLAATILLGLTLLSNHAFGWWLQTREAVVNLHLAWGLLGWAGILIIGVAYQVVPMFQLTQPYPATLTRWLAALLFTLVLGLAPAILYPPLQIVLGMLLAAGFALFAATTLWLQSRRKRKLPDITLSFWRGGMICLLLAIVLWLAARPFPAIAATQSYPLLLGVLMIVGFAMSVINGMLYKIAPFLTWFHLQSRRKAGGPTVPNVRLILPESRMRRQMWLHFSALTALLAAVLLPGFFSWPAAFLFGASNLWLWLNLASVAQTYRRIAPTLQPDGHGHATAPEK